MLIEHPRIYLDASGATTDALLVRDQKVIATGDDARRLYLPHEEVLRPGGACLFPALGDAHIHLWGLGLIAGAVDLRGLDADAIIKALQEVQPEKDQWVFGVNWDEHNFRPHRTLSRALLDRLFPDNPVCLRRVDSHALWVNSAALKIARFQELYKPAAGGHAERDDHHYGELTGRLVDQAMDPILDVLPPASEEADQAVFFQTAEQLRQQGVAFCTLAMCPVDRIPMLQRINEQGTLPLYIDALIYGSDPQIEEALEIGPRGWEKKLRLGGIKFFADGAMGSAGAHLLSPYRTGGVGLPTHEPGFLTSQIPALMRKGWQVAVHAIGDAAAREVLDAFEQVPADLRHQLRPRLEHAQIVAPEDAPRFAALQTVASIQPIHLYSDAPWANLRLFDDQLERLFAWRALLPATFCAGSDYPIDDLNPWHGIATALSRRGADGKVFRPQDRLTRQQILAAYTSGAAFAAHLDGVFGSLHPGFQAQILALDTDPFTATPDEIWDTQALFI